MIGNRQTQFFFGKQTKWILLSNILFQTQQWSNRKKVMAFWRQSSKWGGGKPSRKCQKSDMTFRWVLTKVEVSKLAAWYMNIFTSRNNETKSSFPARLSIVRDSSFSQIMERCCSHLYKTLLDNSLTIMKLEKILWSTSTALQIYFKKYNQRPSNSTPFNPKHNEYLQRKFDMR